MAISLNPNSHIDCFTLVCIPAQRNVSSVEVYAEELVAQLTLVITFDLAGNLLRDVGDSTSGIIAAVHFLDQIRNFTGRYALRHANRAESRWILARQCVGRMLGEYVGEIHLFCPGELEL